MSSITRRACLRNLAGTFFLGCLPAVDARRRQSLDVSWTDRLSTTASFEDVVMLGADQFAVVLGTDDESTPDVIAVTTDGDRMWNWQDPQKTASTWNGFDAVSPAPDGLYLARDTAEDRLDLLNLRSDQSIGWRTTVDIQPLDLGLVRPSDELLVVVSTAGGTHSSTTTIYGIDIDDQSVSWVCEEFDTSDRRGVDAENMYFAPIARAFGDGCLVAGETLDGDQWIAHIDDEGTVVWSKRPVDDALDSIGDVIIGGTDQIVVAGPHSERSQESVPEDTLRILSLGPDGETRWTTNTRLGTDELVYASQVERWGDSSYVFSGTSSGSQFSVALADDRGRVSATYDLQLFDGDAYVDSMVRVGDRLVLAGELRDGGVWIGTLSNEGPTDRSPVDTSASPATEPDSTVSPTHVETERPASTTGRFSSTDADGPGFGAGAAIVGALGGGYLSAKMSNRSQ